MDVLSAGLLCLFELECLLGLNGVKHGRRNDGLKRLVWTEKKSHEAKDLQGKTW